MKKRTIFGPLAVLLVTAVICDAGLRGPGKYSGVVIFDRWGGCTLYSGIYVMYISEATKEGLRNYAGQSVQIDAKEVYQPRNPGDGRIGKFEYLGAAPETQSWVSLTGIQLKSSIKIDESGKAVASLLVENLSDAPVKFFPDELAFTILAKRVQTNHDNWEPSDGPSVALITRESAQGTSAAPNGISEGGSANGKLSWTIRKNTDLLGTFTLEPKRRTELTITFSLPDGEYQFLGGYGGGVHDGKGVASNLSSFDVRNGRASIVTDGAGSSNTKSQK